MPRSVVADAGPLIALGRIDCVSLLPALFDPVLTTTVVLAEVCGRMEYPEGVIIQAAVDAGEISVRTVGGQGMPAGIGAGEVSVVELARQEDCGVLMDDRAGRRLARKLGISIIGVLGVLTLAKRAGHIDRIRPLAESLAMSGYYLSPAVLADACRIAGE